MYAEVQDGRSIRRVAKGLMDKRGTQLHFK